MTIQAEQFNGIATISDNDVSAIVPCIGCDSNSLFICGQIDSSGGPGFFMFTPGTDQFILTTLTAPGSGKSFNIFWMRQS